MKAPLIKGKNVSTSFGAQVVHSNVSFEIFPAEVTALIGTSGGGKTVLLKEIIGLLRPSGGEILIFGKNLYTCGAAEAEDLRRRMGVLFQNGALFSALTVGENVAVPFNEQARLPAGLAGPLVGLKLALSGLNAEVAAKMPAELSGGMRKRAALARALALDPQVLFLDEPTSGLDPISARAFDQLVRTLTDSLGLSVVMVTHDLDTLSGIVDRIIVLGEGRVLVQGSYREVSSFKHPWIEEYFKARAKE